MQAIKPVGVNMKPAEYEKITDERLAYLENWYETCTSNSPMFCDADFFGLVDRLKESEAKLKAVKEQLKTSGQPVD